MDAYICGIKATLYSQIAVYDVYEQHQLEDPEGRKGIGTTGQGTAPHAFGTQP